jgi:hypothetical protein
LIERINDGEARAGKNASKINKKASFFFVQIDASSFDALDAIIVTIILVFTIMISVIFMIIFLLIFIFFFFFHLLSERKLFGGVSRYQPV